LYLFIEKYVWPPGQAQIYTKLYMYAKKCSAAKSENKLRYFLLKYNRDQFTY